MLHVYVQFLTQDLLQLLGLISWLPASLLNYIFSTLPPSFVSSTSLWSCEGASKVSAIRLRPTQTGLSKQKVLGLLQYYNRKGLKGTLCEGYRRIQQWFMYPIILRRRHCCGDVLIIVNCLSMTASWIPGFMIMFVTSSNWWRYLKWRPILV